MVFATQGVLKCNNSTLVDDTRKSRNDEGDSSTRVDRRKSRDDEGDRSTLVDDTHKSRDDEGDSSTLVDDTHKSRDDEGDSSTLVDDTHYMTLIILFVFSNCVIDFLLFYVAFIFVHVLFAPILCYAVRFM